MKKAKKMDKLFINTASKVINKKAKVQFYIFYHAAGSSAQYRKIAEAFPDYIEVFIVEMAGRGTRYMEKLYCSFQEIIDNCLDSIIMNINKPFVFFGHSLGAHIAYRILIALEKTKSLRPLCFFPSSSYAPSCLNQYNILSSPNDQFLVLLYDLIYFGFIPKDLIKEKALVKRIVDIYRADLSILHSLKKQENYQLSCPFTILAGNTDQCVKMDQIGKWRYMTKSRCDIKILEGGHFYLFSDVKKFIHSILEKINV